MSVVTRPNRPGPVKKPNPGSRLVSDPKTPVA